MENWRSKKQNKTEDSDIHLLFSKINLNQDEYDKNTISRNFNKNLAYNVNYVSNKTNKFDFYEFDKINSSQSSEFTFKHTNWYSQNELNSNQNKSKIRKKNKQYKYNNKDENTQIEESYCSKTNHDSNYYNGFNNSSYFFKQFNNAKRLYVDILNYSHLFFTLHDHWNIFSAEKKVEKFVNRCRKSNIVLEIFIDGVYITNEACKKWKVRREKEVRKGERRVPQSTNILFGDLFREKGVAVHYSIEADNDDSMASWAHYNKAAILSRDRDFLRYNDAEYKIYKEFRYNVKNNIIFIEQTHTQPKFGVSSRELIYPPPLSGTKFQEFMLIKNGDYYEYIRGNPSGLVKIFGNLHKYIRTLRQALYSKLGLNCYILEIFPDWDPENSDVIWVEEKVYADNKLDYYLYKPFEAFNLFFSTFKKPYKVTAEEWNNHLYAMHAVVFEICSVAMDTPMLNLVKEASKIFRSNNYFD
jgi:hypothetical protein